MTTKTETKTTADQVTKGQTIRFTGGHSIKVSYVRTTGEYTYISKEGDNGAPYALPSDATVFVLGTEASAARTRRTATIADIYRDAIVAKSATSRTGYLVLGPVTLDDSGVAWAKIGRHDMDNGTYVKVSTLWVEA